MNADGLLVVVEGIDGAGKTTQVQALCDHLSDSGVPFVRTKEPTNGPWGQKIRASAQTGRMSAQDELDAFIQDRREHVRDLIGPALEAGKVVVVDRYFYSTVAYQGAIGFEPSELLELNVFVPAPDLLFIIDVEPRTGLARVRARGDRADLFEDTDNLTRARRIFNGLDGPAIERLDGTQPIATLSESIRTAVDAALAGPIRPRHTAARPTFRAAPA